MRIRWAIRVGETDRSAEQTDRGTADIHEPRDGGPIMNRPTVIRHGEGDPFRFGDVAGRFKIGGDATEGRFVVAELPEIPPRTLAAPLHRHRNEDEYTYVMKGTLGSMIENEVLTAEAGTWLIKPRGQWHTFWNAGDEPCDMIEIVSPAGFESYFREVADTGGDIGQLVKINEKYSIDMKMESVPELCERFRLTFPEMGGARNTRSSPMRSEHG
jgi:mannose-6-phosphate isomerase-like protein (cupin superfamily)